MAVPADNCVSAVVKSSCEIGVCNYYSDEREVSLLDHVDQMSMGVLYDCVRNKMGGCCSLDEGPLNNVAPANTDKEGIVITVMRAKE